MWAGARRRTLWERGHPMKEEKLAMNEQGVNCMAEGKELLGCGHQDTQRRSGTEPRRGYGGRKCMALRLGA